MLERHKKESIFHHGDYYRPLLENDRFIGRKNSLAMMIKRYTMIDLISKNPDLMKANPNIIQRPPG